MGQYDRKCREKELKRKDIIDAAERIIFARGYEKASMDEVAKEAEFSKRTVYVYFSSKEQIYFEIMIRGYRLLIRMIDQSFREARPQNALDELRCLFFALFEFSKEYPEYFRAIMEYETKKSDDQPGVADESQAECYRLGEQIFGYLFHALKRGAAEGTLRRGLDNEPTALTLWACTIGVYNAAEKKGEYLKDYHHLDSHDFVTESFNLIMRLISRNGGSGDESEKGV